MNHKDFINKHKISEYIVGSHLYGTNTESSDVDKSGIFIAPQEYYLGLSSIEEVDLSIVSKLDNGKNDSDAEDIKYYELRKFMKLAIENNPNIIEQLFIKDTLYCNWYGKEILKNSYLFPWKGLKQKFLGYAFSQKHKMLIKTDNYHGLKFFQEYLTEVLLNPREQNKTQDWQFYSNQLLAELRTVDILQSNVKFHEHHALVGDINISLTDKLSKVKAKVDERISKVGNREDLYTKYGYDVKFGMHLIRLMLEGKELLLKGYLDFPLNERDLLLDIRNGKWTKEEVIKFSEEMESEIESIEKQSKLPSSPRYKEIENLLIKLVKEYHESLEAI